MSGYVEGKSQKEGEKGGPKNEACLGSVCGSVSGSGLCVRVMGSAHGHASDVLRSKVYTYGANTYVRAVKTY